MRRSAVVLLLAAGACGPGALSFDSPKGPDGSAAHVWLLRNALARGDAEAARNRLRDKGGAAGDALLRELEKGMVAHYTGDATTAAEAFERAYWLDDARETRSLSKGVAAIVTNDLALPYRPSSTERAMMHYYAALAWTDRGRPDEAVVEARRLSALLAELDDKKQSLSADMTAALHDVAAAVYASAGEWNDADVALRQRDRTYNQMPEATGLWPEASGPRPDCSACGELVLLVERGFVTHRVSRSLGVAIADGDVAIVGGLKDDESGLGAAMLALDRATAPRHCGWYSRGICGYDRRRDFHGDVTVINVAWPELRAPRRVEGPVRLEIGEWKMEIDESGADISASIADDFGRDAPARLARAATRVLARELMMEAGEKALEKADDSKQHKTAWRVAGLVAFVTAGVSAVSEQADTRSWALLPDRVVVKRVQLPAGTYTVHRDTNGRQATKIVVRANATTIAAVRDWGTAPSAVAVR